MRWEVVDVLYPTNDNPDPLHGGIITNHGLSKNAVEPSAKSPSTASSPPKVGEGRAANNFPFLYALGVINISILVSILDVEVAIDDVSISISINAFW